MSRDVFLRAQLNTGVHPTGSCFLLLQFVLINSEVSGDNHTVASNTVASIRCPCLRQLLPSPWWHMTDSTWHWGGMIGSGPLANSTSASKSLRLGAWISAASGSDQRGASPRAPSVFAVKQWLSSLLVVNRTLSPQLNSPQPASNFC